MNSSTNLRDRGISLRKMNIIMVAIAAVTAIALFIAMGKTDELNEEKNNIIDELMVWRTSAYELQIASDYLTEQIRCFVITGEEKYLNNYFEEANVTKRRDNAVQLLRDNMAGTEAVKNLELAMDTSIALMDTEYYAAVLAIGAYGYDLSDFPQVLQKVVLSSEHEQLSDEKKIETARELLFDENYRSHKENISMNMQKCLDDVVRIIEIKKIQNDETLNRQVILEHILTIVMIVILLGIVLMNFFMVFMPLKEAIEYIREDKAIPVKGAYEIRFFARTYNLMNRVSHESKEKLEYQATHDELTGLYNRRGYDFLLNNVDIDTSALLLIDLDEFKKINDTYGHEMGDRALTKVAEVLHKSFRSQDFICRLGGDEFAVIMIHAESELTNLIKDKIHNINEELKVDADKEGLPPISLSAGVVFGDKQHNANNIFKEADGALYKAKADSENDVVFSGLQ